MTQHNDDDGQQQRYSVAEMRRQHWEDQYAASLARWEATLLHWLAALEDGAQLADEDDDGQTREEGEGGP